MTKIPCKALVELYSNPSLSKIQELVYEEYVKNGYKGIWDSNDVSDTIKYKFDLAELGLIITEISEAMEEIRNGNYDKKLGEELADIIIHTLNFASRNNINIESKIIEKHYKNMERKKLHGRKV